MTISVFRVEENQMERFINKICFALTDLGECSALIRTQCENCKFFKTKEQVLEERKRAIARLKGLNGGSYYLQKYHPEEVSMKCGK